MIETVKSVTGFISDINPMLPVHHLTSHLLEHDLTSNFPQHDFSSSSLSNLLLFLVVVYITSMYEEAFYNKDYKIQ